MSVLEVLLNKLLLSKKLTDPNIKLALLGLRIDAGDMWLKQQETHPDRDQFIIQHQIQRIQELVVKVNEKLDLELPKPRLTL